MFLPYNYKLWNISGPNDFHPITVALIKIDTKEITELLTKSTEKIVNLVTDPERKRKVLGVMELFKFSLYKMTTNLAAAQKKEYQEGLIERRMLEDEMVQPFAMNKYTR